MPLKLISPRPLPQTNDSTPAGPPAETWLRLGCGRSLRRSGPPHRARWHRGHRCGRGCNQVGMATRATPGAARGQGKARQGRAACSTRSSEVSGHALSPLLPFKNPLQLCCGQPAFITQVVEGLVVPWYRVPAAREGVCRQGGSGEHFCRRAGRRRSRQSAGEAEYALHALHPAIGTCLCKLGPPKQRRCLFLWCGGSPSSLFPRCSTCLRSSGLLLSCSCFCSWCHPLPCKKRCPAPGTDP